MLSDLTDGSSARDVPHQPVIDAFAERAKHGGTQVVLSLAFFIKSKMLLSISIIVFIIL